MHRESTSSIDYATRGKGADVLLLAKNLLFTLLVPGTVGVYLPLLIARRSGDVLALIWNLRQVVALAPLSIGISIYLWCVWHFAVTGRGTPAPIDGPKRIVTLGLYRYVRNPMYVGVLLVIAGWSLFFGSWDLAGYGVLVGAGFHLFVVGVEEPQLRRRFGDSYDVYCWSTPRWIPKSVGR